MKNKEDRVLIKINENIIFYKIKEIINKIFNRNMYINYNVHKKSDLGQSNEKENFLGYIKNIENEETKLLTLQKQYRNGQLKEEDLTQEQIKLLCDLYDRQISNLKKANKNKKNKILQYRRNFK